MQLDKLRVLRQGHHCIVSTQLERLGDDLSDFEKSQLIDILSANAEIIRALNEKIVNHNIMTSMTLQANFSMARITSSD